MRHILLETAYSATPEAPRLLRHLLDNVIRRSVPHTALRSRMTLCLSEAATNLVLHGDPSWLRLRFGKDGRGWWLELSDNGSAWDPSDKRDDDPSGLFRAVESGRGTAITRAQCDAMSYEQGTTGNDNTLSLRWRMPSRQRTVLLVEDEPASSRLYRLYLQQRYRVISVVNGEDALRELRAGNIDLVLSDIQMPNMNGLDLREAMMYHKASKLTPFIFLTAGDDTRTQARATRLGIDDYLLKPVDKDRLLRCIDRVLQRSSQVARQLSDRIDERISASLAPGLPEETHGWRLALAHRHAGVGGGDLLLYRDSPECLTLALNDIMGHDDSAKFFSYAYAGYLRGLMHACTPRLPAELLSILSDSAMQDALLSQVTLTCCVAELKTDGQLTIASAGHPSPLLINRQGIRPLDVGGVLPGLGAGARYTPLSLTVKSSERVALYTDGLFESAADQAGREHLESQISHTLWRTCERPIEHARDEVMQVFDALAGRPPRDDTLLLLLEPQR